MVNKSTAYLFFGILLAIGVFITIIYRSNKAPTFIRLIPDRITIFSPDTPRIYNSNSFSLFRISKQTIPFISSLITGLLKLIKKSSKRPLQKHVKLNHNFPETNSDIFLKIPTPYDDGTNWIGRKNQATHPSVIQFDTEWNGYKYWMTYTPYPYGNDKKENPSLVSSNDGVNWVVPPKVVNPIISNRVIPSYLFDSYLSDSHLVYNKDKDELELWYRYVSNRKRNEILYRVRSKDTIQWTSPEKLVDDSNNLLQYVSPSVIYEEKKYRMWIMRDWYIYYLESYDGKEWSNPVPVFSEKKPIHSWHPHVCKIGNTYYLLNNDNDTNTGAGGKIYYSLSDDGIYFTKEKIILSSTGNGLSYDSTGVYRASMASGPQGFFLYYGQVSINYQWTIGLSTGLNLNNMRGMDKAKLNRYQKINSDFISNEERCQEF